MRPTDNSKLGWIWPQSYHRKFGSRILAQRGAHESFRWVTIRYGLWNCGIGLECIRMRLCAFWHLSLVLEKWRSHLFAFGGADRNSRRCKRECLYFQ